MKQLTPQQDAQLACALLAIRDKTHITALLKDYPAFVKATMLSFDDNDQLTTVNHQRLKQTFTIIDAIEMANQGGQLTQNNAILQARALAFAAITLGDIDSVRQLLEHSAAIAQVSNDVSVVTFKHGAELRCTFDDSKTLVSILLCHKKLPTPDVLIHTMSSVIQAKAKLAETTCLYQRATTPHSPRHHSVLVVSEMDKGWAGLNFSTSTEIGGFIDYDSMFSEVTGLGVIIRNRGMIDQQEALA